MNKSLNSTESKTTPTNSGYDNEGGNKDIDITPNTPEPKDDSINDYGYDESPSEEEVAAKKVEDDKKTADDKKIADDKKAADEEVKNPATGYGEDENPSEDKKPEVKPEVKDPNDTDEKPEDEVKAAEQLKSDITETLKGLPEGYSQEKTLDFATVNGLSNEQVKAYVEMESAANVNFKQSQADAVVAQKKAFVDELKSDPVFGGENFAVSIKNSERILENHFPNFKKTLTDRGGMVPPYLMKDLLSIHKMLNPTETLITGDPIKPVKKDDGNFLDDLYETE